MLDPEYCRSGNIRVFKFLQILGLVTKFRICELNFFFSSAIIIIIFARFLNLITLYERYCRPAQQRFRAHFNTHVTMTQSCVGVGPEPQTVGQHRHNAGPSSLLCREC